MRMRTLLLAALVVVALEARERAEFEVASIKPNVSAGTNVSLYSSGNGDLTIENAPLRTIVAFAYDVREFQVSGGPKWMDTDRYDIIAKPPHGATANISRAELQKLVRQMTQALLASRFQMVSHPETKDLPVYALVVGKNGPHLTPHTGDSPRKGIGGMPDGLKCTGIAMEIFAVHGLAPRLGNTVLDKTELQGEFDFELHFANEPPPKPGAEAPQAAADPSAPGIATALQEQLGLKLETRKAPVQVIVIERAEKATAN